MKKPIAAALATVLMASTTMAQAGGAKWGYGGHGSGYHGHKSYYGHHYRYRGYGYGYRHHHHGKHGYYVLGGLLAGIVIGHLISRPRYEYPYHRPARQYLPRDCKPTTGVGYRGQRLARFAGTMCYDAYGNAYILNDSVRFIGYVR